MAKLGFSKFDELIGRSDLLQKQKLIEHWKAKNIDVSSSLKPPSITKRIILIHLSKNMMSIKLQIIL